MPSVFSHDFTLEDRSSGSPKLGFMLARRDGVRPYIIMDYPTIPPRTLTMGELTEAEALPEIAQSWKQETWQGGMGGINSRIGNGSVMLARGFKIDSTSLAGIIQLARDVFATTVDSAPDEYKPSGFAVVGTEVWAFVGRDVYSWNYTDKSWKIGTEPVVVDRLYRNGVEYEGNTYVPTWAPGSGPGALSYLYKADSDANWIGSTLDAVAAKYMASADGKLWAGYIGVIGASYSRASGMLIGDTTIVLVGDTTGTLTTNDYMLLERRAANEEIIQLTNAGTFAAGNTTYNCSRAQLGTTAKAHSVTPGANHKYTRNVHHVHSSTDGTNTGSWTSATEIDTSDSAITALVPYFNGYEELLVVCKTNGLWTLNQYGETEILHNMRAYIHPDNFRNAYAWDGNRRVLLPVGGGGLFELYQGTVRDISFLKTMPDQTQLHGIVAAVGSDATHVFVLVQETANTRYHLMMGELVDIGGVTDYRWHHVGAISYTTGTNLEHAALFAEGVPSGSTLHHRIWAGIESTGSNLLPYFYPLESDDELVYTDDTDVEADTVADDRNHPNVNKRYGKVDVTTKNLGAGANDHYSEVQYRVDGGSWTWVTGTQSTSKLTTSPQTLTFGAELTGKEIELRFKPRRGTTTTTSPQILDFRVTSQFRPTPVKAFPQTVYLADGQVLRNGGRQWTAVGDLSQLTTWNAQAAELVYTDPTDTIHNVVFLPGSMKVAELQKVAGHRPEYQVDFSLAEV